MGSLKDWYDAMTPNGMDFRRVDSKAVCRRCVQDVTLAEWVARNARGGACSYCDRAGAKGRVVLMTDLVWFVNNGLETAYEDAVGALGLDDESENGFYGATEDTADLFERELALSDPDAPFARDLLEAVGDRTWCKLDPYGAAEEELLSWSWRGFRETTLHDSRWFFREAANGRRRPDDEVPAVEELLDGLMRYCRRAKLFRTLPAGKIYYRCQVKKDGETAPFSAGRMGPPPKHLARQANRMSPAGVPMLRVKEPANRPGGDHGRARPRRHRPLRNAPPDPRTRPLAAAPNAQPLRARRPPRPGLVALPEGVSRRLPAADHPRRGRAHRLRPHPDRR